MMSKEKNQKAAKHILDDRHGADYFQDVGLLSRYLMEALGFTHKAADKTAKAIQEDRHGANYYENINILTDVLENSLTNDKSERLEQSSNFETKHLPMSPDVVAPDGSDVRILLGLKGGGMAHFELEPNKISKAVTHKTVEEIWFFLSGRGQMWRSFNGKSEIVDVFPGICLTIPLGTHFQFRSFGYEPLSAIGVTMPPWPGEGEATVVTGKW